jgi:hypothetical protein
MSPDKKMDKEESEHFISVLEETKNALLQQDILKLKELSDNTIHSASSQQDSASISMAVIIYALGKLVERRDRLKIRDWNSFVKKFNSAIGLAIKALKDDNEEAFQRYVEAARKVITSEAISIKPFVQEILKKASINKGSKIYEHGISIEQTSKLLGISQWELSDYVGQKAGSEIRQNFTMDEKKRAKMALEFFS